MRKLFFILPIALMFAGCGTQETFETVGDTVQIPVMAQAQQLVMQLPDSAQAPVLQSENAGKVYFCDDCVITVQITEGGDVQETIFANTGFEADQLQVMKTQTPEAKRYECVWTAVGEGGEQVGRLCVLDDGTYHYAVTAMADAQNAGSLRQTWQTMFDTMQLLPADANISTGS